MEWEQQVKQLRDEARLLREAAKEKELLAQKIESENTALLLPFSVGDVIEVEKRTFRGKERIQLLRVDTLTRNYKSIWVQGRRYKKDLTPSANRGYVVFPDDGKGGDTFIRIAKKAEQEQI